MLYGVARYDCIERLEMLYRHAGFQDDLFETSEDDPFSGTVFVCSDRHQKHRFVWQNRQLFIFLLKGADLYTRGHHDPYSRAYRIQVLEILENYRQEPTKTNWLRLAPLPRNPLGYDGTIGETLANLINGCSGELLWQYRGNRYHVPPMENHFLGHPIDDRTPPDTGLVTAIVLAHRNMLDNELDRIRQERGRYVTLPIALDKVRASILMGERKG